VLSIEPKEEKVKKPKVCQNHFTKNDFDVKGELKPGVRPKKLRKNFGKKGVRVKKVEVIEDLTFSNQMEEEPMDFEEIIEETKIQNRDLDQNFLDSLLPKMRKMNPKQKKKFKNEMMLLINVGI
jgi:BESS motif